MSIKLPDLITFDITQQHIEKAEKKRGKSSLCANCVIAQAIEAWLASVDLKSIVLVGPDMIMILSEYYDHTPQTKNIMEKFDNRQKISPCTITIKKIN